MQTKKTALTSKPRTPTRFRCGAGILSRQTAGLWPARGAADRGSGRGLPGLIASLPGHGSEGVVHYDRNSLQPALHQPENIMIDHVGFSVSDYARAKAFYEKALAPLGYTLIMEVGPPQSELPAAGFGSGGKPDLWIGGDGRLERPVHIAILAKDRPTVDAFYRAALAAGGKDNGPQAFARTTTRITTVPLCSIPMGTISKRSVMLRASTAFPWRESHRCHPSASS
jgi:catechol 2,3-dioxygenase-like lactoylglutathione lyase family enzyme